MESMRWNLLTEIIQGQLYMVIEMVVSSGLIISRDGAFFTSRQEYSVKWVWRMRRMEHSTRLSTSFGGP